MGEDAAPEEEVDDVAKGEDADSGLELASGVTALLSLEGDATAKGGAEVEEDGEDSDVPDVSGAPDIPDVPDAPPVSVRGRFELSDETLPGIDLGPSSCSFDAGFGA